MADGRRERDELAFAILRSLRRLLQQVSTHSRELARDTGLTVPQLLCLKAVDEAYRDDETTLATVSARVGLSPSTTSAIVERLVRAGLLTRDRSPLDRRRLVLSVTPEGRARLHDVPAPLQERFLARLGALDVAERQQILDVLERVVGLMGAGDLEAAPVLVTGGDIAEE